MGNSADRLGGDATPLVAGRVSPASPRFPIATTGWASKSYTVFNPKHEKVIAWTLRQSCIPTIIHRSGRMRVKVTLGPSAWT